MCQNSSNYTREYKYNIYKKKPKLINNLLQNLDVPDIVELQRNNYTRYPRWRTNNVCNIFPL